MKESCEMYELISKYMLLLQVKLVEVKIHKITIYKILNLSYENDITNKRRDAHTISDHFSKIRKLLIEPDYCKMVGNYFNSLTTKLQACLNCNTLRNFYKTNDRLTGLFS